VLYNILIDFMANLRGKCRSYRGWTGHMKGIALALAQSGANVIVTDVSDIIYRENAITLNLTLHRYF
jgi:hypothetical protein